MGFKMDDYVEVPERIELFYTTYPDGRLVTDYHEVIPVGDKSYTTVRALAYRTADDPLPAVGIAWEITPGKTPYTKDSELMNAETSAWGRAIVALGPPFVTKRSKIASREEVELRQEQTFADKVRETGMKANDLMTYFKVCQVDIGSTPLAEYLNDMNPVAQQALLDWAKGENE
jgi:hypothetical protein